MICWNACSYEVEKIPSNSSLIQDIEFFGIGEHEPDKNIFTVRTHGMKSEIFHLEDYICSQPLFQGIVRFFKHKDFSKEIRVIKRDRDKTWSEKNFNFSDEVSKIKKLMSENNINIDVDNRTLYNIPISIFNSKSQNVKVKRTKYIFLMILFSNYSSFENNNFEFKIIIDDNEIIRNYSFEDEISDNQLEYFEELYNWIIGDGDNYKQKLNVVRSAILRNKSFIIKKSLLNSVNSIFQRIINAEANKYFEEVARLKDDFLKITQRENDIYQSLHLKLIGWLSAIALMIFNKIKDYDGSDVINRLLDSDSQKTKLILLLLIGALGVILIIYILEMRKNQDEYWRLKHFYTNSLMFNSDDFENKVRFPRVDDRYIVLIFGIACILFLRVLFSKVGFIIVIKLVIMLVISFLGATLLIDKTLPIKKLIKNISAKLNKKEEIVSE